MTRISLCWWSLILAVLAFPARLCASEGVEFWFALSRSLDHMEASLLTPAGYELRVQGETAGTHVRLVHRLDSDVDLVLFESTSDPSTQVGPTSPLTIPVSALLEMVGQASGVEHRGLRLTSDAPVSAILYQAADPASPPFGSDACRLLPNSSLGTEYTVPLFAPLGWHHSHIYFRYLIVATADNTRVVLEPSAQELQTNPDAAERIVYLNRFDVFQETFEQTSGLKAGPMIRSNKPVAVLSSSEAIVIHEGAVGDWPQFSWDVLLSENVPSAKLGTDYLVPPLPASWSAGWVVRITAIDDDTDVTVHSAAAPLVLPTMHRGEAVDLSTAGGRDPSIYTILPGPLRIVSNGPICVAVYCLSSRIDDPVYGDQPYGDPLQINIAPTSEFVSRATFSAIPHFEHVDTGIDYFRHYVLVVAPTSDAAGTGIKLNNTDVSTSSLAPDPDTEGNLPTAAPWLTVPWTAFPSVTGLSDFSYAIVHLPKDSLTVPGYTLEANAAGTATIAGYVVGLGPASGYGYVAGLPKGTPQLIGGSSITELLADTDVDLVDGSVLPAGVAFDGSRALHWEFTPPAPGESVSMSYQLSVRDLSPGMRKQLTEMTRLTFTDVLGAPRVRTGGPLDIAVGSSAAQLSIASDADDYVPSEPATFDVRFTPPDGLSREVLSDSAELADGEFKNIDAASVPGTLRLAYDGAEFASDGTARFIVDAQASAAWDTVGFQGGFPDAFDYYSFADGVLASGEVRDVAVLEIPNYDPEDTTAWYNDSTKSWYRLADDTVVDHAMSMEDGGYLVVPQSDIIDELLSSDNFTIEGWMWTSPWTSDDMDVVFVEHVADDSSQNRFVIRRQANGDLHVEVGNELNTIPSSDLQWDVESNWHHIAFIVDDGVARLLIDGHAVSSPANMTGTFWTSYVRPLEIAELIVGRVVESVPGDRRTGARIDELRLYAKALTDTEIASSHAAGEGHALSPVDPRGLVGYWNFDCTPRDQSGNGLGGRFTEELIGGTTGTGRLFGRITGRNSQGRFPRKLYCVVTDVAVDLIDADAGSLWMRIWTGGGRVDQFLFIYSGATQSGTIGGTPYSARPDACAASDGRIYLSSEESGLDWLSILSFKEDRVFAVVIDDPFIASGVYQRRGFNDLDATANEKVLDFSLINSAVVSLDAGDLLYGLSGMPAVGGQSIVAMDHFHGANGFEYVALGTRDMNASHVVYLELQFGLVGEPPDAVAEARGVFVQLSSSLRVEDVVIISADEVVNDLYVLNRLNSTTLEIQTARDLGRGQASFPTSLSFTALDSAVPGNPAVDPLAGARMRCLDVTGTTAFGETNTLYVGTESGLIRMEEDALGAISSAVIYTAAAEPQPQTNENIDHRAILPGDDSIVGAIDVWSEPTGRHRAWMSTISEESIISGSAMAMRFSDSVNPDEITAILSPDSTLGLPSPPTGSIARGLIEAGPGVLACRREFVPPANVVSVRARTAPTLDALLAMRALAESSENPDYGFSHDWITTWDADGRAALSVAGGRFLDLHVRLERADPQVSPVIDELLVEYTSATTAIDVSVETRSEEDEGQGTKIADVSRIVLGPSDYDPSGVERFYLREFDTGLRPSGDYRARATLVDLITGEEHATATDDFTILPRTLGEILQNDVLTDKGRYRAGETVEITSKVWNGDQETPIHGLRVRLTVEEVELDPAPANEPQYEIAIYPNFGLPGPMPASSFYADEARSVIVSQEYLIDLLPPTPHIDAQQRTFTIALDTLPSTPPDLSALSQLDRLYQVTEPDRQYRVRQTVEKLTAGGPSFVSEDIQYFQVFDSVDEDLVLTGTVNASPKSLRAAESLNTWLSATIENGGNIGLQNLDLELRVANSAGAILETFPFVVPELGSGESASFQTPFYAASLDAFGGLTAFAEGTYPVHLIVIDAETQENPVRDYPPGAEERLLDAAALYVSTEQQTVPKPAYVIIDLGTLGGATSAALGINNQGEVVGEALNASGVARPVVWRCGNVYDIGEDVVALVGGNGAGAARAVNDTGWVVGEMMDGTTPLAFRWLLDGQSLTSLGVLGGESTSSAYGVSNQGDYSVVVGKSGATPFRWVDLPSAPPAIEPVFTGEGAGLSINRRGNIVGVSPFNSGANSQGFILADGQLQSGWLDEYVQGEFSSINDLDVAVGRGEDASGDSMALLTTPTYSSRMGAAAELPRPAIATGAGARAINNTGVVVGYYDAGGQRHGALWQGGQVRAIDDLLPAPFEPCWNVEEATGINERGDVVGIGSRAGGPAHAFKMEALPFPGDILDSLALWTRADAGAETASGMDEVLAWRDLTCAARDFTSSIGAGSPVLVAETCCRPSLQFDADGNDDLVANLAGADFSSGDGTLFVVMNVRSLESGPLFATGSSTDAVELVIDSDDNGVKSFQLQRGGLRSGGGGEDPDRLVGLKQGMMLITLRTQGSSTSAEVRVNASPLPVSGSPPNNTINLGAAVDFTSLHLGRGRSISSGTEWFKSADVYEIMLFEERLDNNKQGEIESYLMSKYQIAPEGDVGDPLIWLRGDAGLVTDENGNVSEWHAVADNVVPIQAVASQRPSVSTFLDCRPTPNFAGNDVLAMKPIDIVFIIDVSGSMQHQSPPNPSGEDRLTPTKAATLSFIDRLVGPMGVPDSRVGLMWFSDQFDGPNDLTPPLSDTFVVDGTSNHGVIRLKVPSLLGSSDPDSTDPDDTNSVRGRLSTDPEYGLKAIAGHQTYYDTALERLRLEFEEARAENPGRRQVAVFLSDGKPEPDTTNQITTSKQETKLMREAGVEFYTIGVGTGIDGDLLEAMSGGPDSGRHFLANLTQDPNSIEARYEGIFDLVVSHSESATITTVFRIADAGVLLPSLESRRTIFALGNEHQGAMAYYSDWDDRLYFRCWNQEVSPPLNSLLFTPVGYDVPHLLEVVFEDEQFDLSVNVPQLWLDGELIEHFMAFAPTNRDFDIPLNQVAVGSTGGQMRFHDSSNPVDGEYFYGQVAELLIYDKALDSAERAAVRSYLEDKYDLNVMDPELFPVADAGEDVFIDQTHPDFPPQQPGETWAEYLARIRVAVELDGTGSIDPEGALAESQYEWYSTGSYSAFGAPPIEQLIGTGSRPVIPFGIGSHDVGLRVTGAAGLVDTDIVRVRVSIAPPVIAGGVQGDWRLDHPVELSDPGAVGYGVVQDSSSYGRDALLSAVPMPAGMDSLRRDGRSEWCFELDGTTTAIDLTHLVTSGELPSGDAARTIAGWFEVSSQFANSSPTFFAQGGADVFAIEANGARVAAHIGSDVRGKDDLSLSEGWHHVAVVVPGPGAWSDDVQIYLDGEPLTVQPLAASPNPVPVNTGTLWAYFGRGPSSQHQRGRLDELRIYAQSLDASDVLALYQQVAYGHWKLNEGQGDAFDTTAIDQDTANRATLVGGAAWDSGAAAGQPRETVLHANGAAQYADTTVDMFDPGTEPAFTVAVWARLDQIDPNVIGPIVQQTNGAPYDIMWLGAGNQDGGGAVAFTFFGGHYFPFPGLQAGTWHHFALTYEEGYIRVFADGQLLGGGSAPTAPGSAIGPLRFGGAWAPAAWEYKGMIDDVRIYRYALTPQEVTDVYNKTK